MKKINLQVIGALIMISFLCSSCEVIEGIFKAGMGFIAAVIFKLRKRN